MLAPGSRIGSYELLAPLGTGGMGEVYRARDLRLGREVAIKLLPDQFARDPDRLARFQREAQVLASLNHPNIAAIYGLEESDDTKALILELVPVTGKRAFEGEDVAETLAAILTKSPDWTNLVQTPRALVRLLRRMLAKQPRQRLGDLSAVRLEITDILADVADEEGSTSARSGTQRQYRRWIAALPLQLWWALSLPLDVKRPRYRCMSCDSG